MRERSHHSEIFLIKSTRLAAALAAAFAPAASFAEMSYSSVDISWIDSEFDNTDLDGNGIEIAGSYQLNEQFFVLGKWLEQDLDFGIDATFIEFGAGLRKPLQDDLDFVGTLSYVDVEIGNGDDDGLAVAAGVRAQLADAVQIEAMLRLVDYDDLDSDSGIVLTGRYYFSQTMAVTLGLDFTDLADSVRLGFRAEF
jgi:hypothetical protein